jgi:hypothetical protein
MIGRPPGGPGNRGPGPSPTQSGPHARRKSGTGSGSQAAAAPCPPLTWGPLTCAGAAAVVGSGPCRLSSSSGGSSRSTRLRLSFHMAGAWNRPSVCPRRSRLRADAGLRLLQDAGPWAGRGRTGAHPAPRRPRPQAGPRPSPVPPGPAPPGPQAGPRPAPAPPGPAPPGPQAGPRPSPARPGPQARAWLRNSTAPGSAAIPGSPTTSSIPQHPLPSLPLPQRRSAPHSLHSPAPRAPESLLWPPDNPTPHPGNLSPHATLQTRRPFTLRQPPPRQAGGRGPSRVAMATWAPRSAHALPAARGRGRGRGQGGASPTPRLCTGLGGGRHRGPAPAGRRPGRPQRM